jgi:hypothetical protein
MNLIIILFLINQNINNYISQVNISNIHAIYTFVISILYLTNYNIIVLNYLKLLYLSCFYSIYDIVYLYNTKIKGYISLIVHHLLIVYVVNYANIYLNSDEKIVELIAINYLTEISTPFVNRSFQLVENKKENTLEFKITNTLVLAIFGIFRVFTIPYLLYQCYNYSYNVVICQTLLSSMNLVWFYKMCKYYKKTIMNNEKKIS